MRDKFLFGLIYRFRQEGYLKVVNFTVGEVYLLRRDEPLRLIT
jgi:hypothetical protein